MTNRTSPIRGQTRFPVSWPVLYGGDDVVAEGTVLDLTRLGWRVAGAMPVRPGMLLTLVAWVPDKQDPIRIEQATVLWVNGCEFAIESHKMAPGDDRWVIEFLNRNLGLPWIGRAEDNQPCIQPIIDTTSRTVSFQQTRTRRFEDHLWHFKSAQPDLNSPDVKADLPIPLTPYGGESQDYRTASARWLREVWQPALRIARGIRARRAYRLLTGEDSILNN